MIANNIRLLLADEVSFLLPLARGFYSEGNLPGKLNEQHCIENVRKIIESGNGFVLAAGFPIQGAICGLMFRDANTADPCCMEHFWYVLPEQRGSIGIRLLDAWEKEAISRGAKRLLMAHIHTDKTSKFTDLYERKGYRMQEQIFSKEVSR